MRRRVALARAFDRLSAARLAAEAHPSRHLLPSILMPEGLSVSTMPTIANPFAADFNTETTIISYQQVSRTLES